MRTVVCERFLMPLLCALGLLLGAHAARADTAPTYIYVTPRTGIPGNPVMLAAVLRTHGHGNKRLNGKTLTFKLDGQVVGHAQTRHYDDTGEDGAARLDGNDQNDPPYVLPADITAGDHIITVEFAGDDDYDASTGTGTLTVGKADTYLYATPRSGKPGRRVAFFGVLSRNIDHSVRLNGRTLTFKLDAGTNNEILLGTARTGHYDPTNEDGSARLNYTLPADIRAGDHTITVAFDGDDDDNGSIGQATLTVNDDNQGVQTGESHGTIDTDANDTVYIDMTVIKHNYNDGHSDISGSALLNGTTADGQIVAVSILAKDLDFSWVTVQGQQYRHVQVTTNTFVFYTGGRRVRAYLQVDVTDTPGAGQMGFKVLRASDGATMTATTDADGNYTELPLEDGGWTAVKF